MEDILQHERRGKADNNPSVQNAVREHFFRGSEKYSDGFHKGKTEHREDHAHNDSQVNHHGEIAVCALVILLTQNDRYQRGAAGADHKAHATENHDEGHHKVDRGKGGFPGIV